MWWKQTGGKWKQHAELKVASGISYSGINTKPSKEWTNFICTIECLPPKYHHDFHQCTVNKFHENVNTYNIQKNIQLNMLSLSFKQIVSEFLWSLCLHVIYERILITLCGYGFVPLNRLIWKFTPLLIYENVSNCWC